MASMHRIKGTTQSQFAITPASSSGPPTTGLHCVGELHVDSLGDRYYCIAEGTPGTWIFINDGFKDSFSRAQNGATNIWLRTVDRNPCNLAPLVIPYDCRLYYITASTNGNETCDFEVYKNADVRAGGTPSDPNKIAELVFTAQQNGKNDLSASPVDLDEDDEIGVYMRGSGINRPRVNLFFQRRYG